MAQSRSRAVKNKPPVKKRVSPPSARLFYVFLTISLLYILISLFGPVDQATLDKYKLSTAKIHQLNLTVVLPLVAVWFSAYYGYSRIREYARAVRSSNEGPGLTRVAHGLGMLAFSLPVNSLMTASANAYAVDHPSYMVPLTVIKNYASLVLPLIAFTLICRGSAELVTLIRRPKVGTRTQELWSLGIIALSSLFTWLIIARPADSRSPLNVYQLPDWLIVTTIAIPYLYIWIRGLISVHYITAYQRNVKGHLYRTSLRKLSAGLMVVIMINILIQIIVSVSSRLYRLQLTPILILVYFLIALYAVGFGLIASGAKKLNKIEEV